MEYIALFTSLMLLILSLDLRNLFLTRNLFLVYIFLRYNVSPLIFTEFDASYFDWYIEYVVVVLMFVSGYFLGIYTKKRTYLKLVNIITEDNLKKINRLKILFWLMFAFNFIFILKLIANYGFLAFYSGDMLVDTIKNYGSANAEGALNQVITMALGSAMLALLAVILERTIVRLSNEKPNGAFIEPKDARKSKRLIITLSGALFIILPLLQFSRGSFVLGSIAFMAIYYWSGLRYSNKSFFVVGIAAMTFFIIVGQSRGMLLGDESNASSHFASELTPWIAYRDIKENIDYLEYQYGTTLVIPLVMQIIPRGIWPEKPDNTTAYFNKKIYPDSAGAGFMLAPTVVGILYLNFGIYGVFIGVVLLGFFSGRIDAIVLYKNFHRFGIFVIIFYSYFSLLRNDTSVVVFIIIITTILYHISRRTLKLI